MIVVLNPTTDKRNVLPAEYTEKAFAKCYSKTREKGIRKCHHIGQSLLPSAEKRIKIRKLTENNPQYKMKKIIIQLTTFRGQCVEAIHYYASVAYYDKNNNYCSEKLKRPITQKEIESDKDRFYAYEVGDLTECFASWKPAIEAAKEYIESNNLDGIVYVDGIPNNGMLALEQVLSPELDTRKKCSKCGHVFGHREGLYNFPSGALCVQCHKNPKE